MREIFDGSIPVSDDGYTQAVGEDDEVEEVPDLDKRVSAAPILRFTLDYPFEREYHGQVVTDAGATLRQIIDAIRAGFRAMYRGTTTEDIANLENKRVRGDFGEAYHVIDDLVIEGISLDDATGTLDISIGS